MDHKLLKTASLLEAATGAVLVLAPAVFLRLLFGDAEVGLGASVGRVAGVALGSLGVACWPKPSGNGLANVAMMLYNVGAVAILFSIGFRGQTVGIALWPGVVLHFLLVVAFVVEIARAGAPRS